MAGSPSLAKELQQNAQSNAPLNVLARASLNKRGREEVEIGDGGAGGWEVRPASEQPDMMAAGSGQAQLVPPASGQMQLAQSGSGQVQMVQSNGMDPAVFLSLVQCMKDMQEKNLQCIKDMRADDRQMQEKNLQCLLELQERSVQRVIDAEVKVALAAEREAVSNREKKALKVKMTKLEKLAKK